MQQQQKFTEKEEQINRHIEGLFDLSSLESSSLLEGGTNYADLLINDSYWYENETGGWVVHFFLWF